MHVVLLNSVVSFLIYDNLFEIGIKYLYGIQNQQIQTQEEIANSM